MGMGFPVPGRFREQFRCYSMVFSTKDSVEVKHGGKIIMPASALEKLARLNISYPMLFKLSNDKKGLYSHCGVLEFIAEEGRIYVPHWVSYDEVTVEPLIKDTPNSGQFPMDQFIFIVAIQFYFQREVNPSMMDLN